MAARERSAHNRRAARPRGLQGRDSGDWNPGIGAFGKKMRRIS